MFKANHGSRINFLNMFSLNIFEQAVAHLYLQLLAVKPKNKINSKNITATEKAQASHPEEAEGWWLKTIFHK